MVKPVIDLHFTEEAKGFISIDADSYELGFLKGKENNDFFMFHSDIVIEDLFTFNKNPSLPSPMFGWIYSNIFGGKIPYEKAYYNLYIDTDNPKHKYMKYRIYFRSKLSKEEYTFYGFKEVKDNSLCDLWKDTTVFYTRIYKGFTEREDDLEVIAKGIIEILALDFLRQLTTFRPKGADLFTNLEAFSDFNKMFLGTLYNIYAPNVLTNVCTPKK